jgi:molybdenum cofactor biosynthesis enzyme MoaA
MNIRLSVNITYRCNTVCAHCNRGIGALDWRNVRDMTLDDVDRIIAACNASEHTVTKAKLMGGEPVLHKATIRDDSKQGVGGNEQPEA